ncbi:MAG: 4'-phosphopantetheinyl transferase superfamily protein [Oscillospiraceae bacterium]|nr:4'-phosphopantetheinyl transferase superfamily protein [Oscillospiraceae bacterium]
MIFYTTYEDAQKRPEQHKIAYALLDEVLKKHFGIISYTIEKNENGKPFLLEFPDVHFNISHCDGLAVCGISDKEIGVDAELIKGYNSKAMKRIFSAEEQSMIEASENPDTDFFKIWTLKESLCKFTGEGIFSGLSEYSFDLSQDNPICRKAADKIFTQKIIEKKWVISVCAHDPENNFAFINKNVFLI